MAGLLQLSLLAAVALTVISSLLSGFLYLACRSRLARWAPAPRVAALVLWTASPALLGFLLTGLCFVPSLLAILAGSAGDHCVAHPDHHMHLCLLHPPHEPGSAIGWILAATAASAAAWVVGRYARSMQRTRHALRRLHSGAEPDGTRAVAWVRSPLPLALTVGILSPRVLVSHALRDLLPARLLDAVLEHEAAHQRRGDVLWKALASSFALLHWPTIHQRLLDDLSLACEQAADAEAAEKLQSPVVVADAILAVERLTLSHSHDTFATAASFGGPHVTARIEELLGPRAYTTAPRLGRWMAGTAAAGFLLAETVHHVVETLLTPLAR